jgi:hypothetical protein
LRQAEASASRGAKSELLSDHPKCAPGFAFDLDGRVRYDASVTSDDETLSGDDCPRLPCPAPGNSGGLEQSRVRGSQRPERLQIGYERLPSTPHFR